MSDQTRANLDAAIREHAQAEWGGDLTVDWILVAGLVGQGHSIGIETSRGDDMPGYVSNGLLYEAMQLGQYETAEDDD